MSLSPEQLTELAAARARSKPIRRTVSIAKFDGWGIAIFAALTFAGGLFHWLGFVLGAAMATVAFIELAGAQRLRTLDLTAPRALALNQIFLGSVLLLYAIYSLWSLTHDTSFISSQLSSADMAQLGADIPRLAKLIGWLIYGTLACVAIFFQGGLALFYFSRRKHMEKYIADTPAWIVQAQRAGLSM